VSIQLLRQKDLHFLGPAPLKQVDYL